MLVLGADLFVDSAVTIARGLRLVTTAAWVLGPSAVVAYLCTLVQQLRRRSHRATAS